MKDDLKIGLAASTIALGTYLAYRGISKTRLDLSQSNASVATENQDVPRINSHGDVSASPKKLPINEVSFDELPSIKRVRASICLQEPEEPAQSDYSDECTTARLLSELTEEIQEDIQNAEIEKLTSPTDPSVTEHVKLMIFLILSLLLIDLMVSGIFPAQ